MLNQKLKAFGDVQVDGGRDLAEVAHRDLEFAGSGESCIYIKTAAPVERQANVMVSAEGVVPWGPIAEDGRFVAEKFEQSCDLFLVAAQHALRVHDAFGGSCRAGGEDQLCNGVRIDLVVRGVDFFGDGGVEHITQSGRIDQLHVWRRGGGDRGCELREVVREDQAGRDDVKDVFELCEIGGD